MKHFSSSRCLDSEALLQLLQRRGGWTQIVLAGYFKHQLVLPQNYCTHVGLVPASHHSLLLFTLPCWLRQTCNTESLVRADICMKTILYACMHIYSMSSEWASQMLCRKRKDPLILGCVEGGREQWACDWPGRETTVQVWPLGSPRKPHSATTIAAHTRVQQLEPCLRPSVQCP